MGSFSFCNSKFHLFCKNFCKNSTNLDNSNPKTILRPYRISRPEPSVRRFALRKNANKSVQHGQNHNKVLIAAGHLKRLNKAVAAGAGEAKEQTGKQSRHNLPVSENQRSDAKISVPHINAGGKLCGNRISKADAAKSERGTEIIIAERRILFTFLPAASTAWGLSPQARRCMPNLVLYITNHARNATATMMISNDINP